MPLISAKTIISKMVGNEFSSEESSDEYEKVDSRIAPVGPKQPPTTKLNSIQISGRIPREGIKGLCAICLNHHSKQWGKLQCQHIFCMSCLTSWWRKNFTCPVCRNASESILCHDGKTILFSDLPPEEEDPNLSFVPRCELCWGDIEPHQLMNICTQCRSVYWHSDCLPGKASTWYCTQCGQT